MALPEKYQNFQDKNILGKRDLDTLVRMDTPMGGGDLYV